MLVSQALPKGVESFDVIDGVWVTSPRAALPVATVLRHSLQQVSMARAISEGQHTKTEMVYQYLTGPRFRHRVEAIVEAFSSMQEDLDKERKVIMKQWAKREEQIERVMGATVGMYGDLQGIAGKSLQEIEGLEFPSLGVDGSILKQV
nr:K389 [uncultured bacterium]